MLLSELKQEIDAALKMQDDYVVKIRVNEVELSIEDAGVNADRFNFLIVADEDEAENKLQCLDYHIDDDEEMEFCDTCNVYYVIGDECPKCKLTKLQSELEDMQEVMQALVDI